MRLMVPMCLLISVGCYRSVPEQTPELTAALRKAKSACEEEARAVKTRPQRRFPRKQAPSIEEGRRLYTDAKAEFDGCITYLCTALSRGITKSELHAAQDRLNESVAKADRFLEWSEAKHGGRQKLSLQIDVAKLISELARLCSDANDQRIQEIKKELEACRLSNWSDL